jgi:tetratricopeptide (TPR) repeat protein
MKKLSRADRIKLLQQAKDIASLEHDCEKALKKVDLVLESNPSDIDGLILRGNILDLCQNFNESLKCYERALKIDKNNVRALIDMGDWHSNKDDFKKALSFYEIALSLLKKGVYYLSREEELQEVYLNKTLLLKDQGMVNEAIETVQDAIANCPGFRPPPL